jgi:hypothetical protein
MRADSLALAITWFPTAKPNGPALGDPEKTTWGAFAGVFWFRREGPQDGPLFVPSRFKVEPDGRHVRRQARNVIARSAIALDIEAQAGERPPSPAEAACRAESLGWASLIYTSHSHIPDKEIRFRMVMPLSGEIAPNLPAPEVIAGMLGLSNVVDRSKVNPASAFYLPSCPNGSADQHELIVTQGDAIDAGWLIRMAADLFTERQTEQDRVAVEAHATALARIQARRAAGFDPDDSLIEKLRKRLDLRSILLAHSYAQAGCKYRHPNSQSGSFGADIKTFGGIERIYSHNAYDPLHRDNLPDWCGGVSALDAVDAVAILDFGGDRPAVLRHLSERFGFAKTDERRALAKLIFHLVRKNAAQEAIEASALAEGLRLGLSRAEVISVARWCAEQLAVREAA